MYNKFWSPCPWLRWKSRRDNDDGGDDLKEDKSSGSTAQPRTMETCCIKAGFVKEGSGQKQSVKKCSVPNSPLKIGERIFLLHFSNLKIDKFFSLFFLLLLVAEEKDFQLIVFISLLKKWFWIISLSSRNGFLASFWTQVHCALNIVEKRWWKRDDH